MKCPSELARLEFRLEVVEVCDQQQYESGHEYVVLLALGSGEALPGS